MIELRCPCGYERPVPELYDGPEIKCPNCGKAIPIPVKPPPPPMPPKWVLGGFGIALVLVWVLFQSSGFLCIRIPDLQSFDTSREAKWCAYRECKEPSDGMAMAHVTFVPSGISAPVYEDRSFALCSYHAKCARQRSWESSTWLKHPAQLLVSIVIAAFLIGIPCLALHITGKYSFPKL